LFIVCLINITLQVTSILVTVELSSEIVEIQEEQKLIDTGLYSVVRHAMYLAACVIFCFSPLILGSYYALFPAIFIPVFIGMRIKNEEMILQKGLKGYDLYMKKVKYKLMPYIW
jgi:protein-S-isoprenylcysteine O-methyltransferase Ste14